MSVEEKHRFALDFMQALFQAVRKKRKDGTAEEKKLAQQLLDEAFKQVDD